MNNTIGVVLGFGLVFFVLGVATFLKKFTKISTFETRKLIHIGVSNWWIVLMLFMDNVYYAVIGPIAFIVLNYISYKSKLFKAMELEDEKSLGTVYFPISLLLIVICVLKFKILPVYAGGIAMMILGYGDGLAAWIGKKYGKIKYPFGEKTLGGSAVMFLASLIVTIIFSGLFNDVVSGGYFILLGCAASTAAVAAIVEGLTPYGLDNITVPLSVAAFYGLVWV